MVEGGAEVGPSTGQPSIQAIQRGDVHRITSGQVILDVQSVVKELLENAIDAQATSIEVRFKEYGAEAIEVLDNGTGIDPSNYHSLALKHHTSKLHHFTDLLAVDTFGFRGEALSSLCEVAKVQFTTATEAQQPVGTILDMARDGSVASSDRRQARQRGTTVTVTDLFHNLPVRRKEMVKNIRREFAKAQALLQSYALVSQGVRWQVTNTVKGRRNVVMTIAAASGSDHMTANVAALFGPKANTDLVSLRLRIPLDDAHHQQASYTEDDADGEQPEEGHARSDLLITGLISRPALGCGRTSSDRTFLYVNGRPWEAPKVIRAFNEVYRQFNVQQYPTILADFRLRGDQYDVNVSPDKRTLFLHREAIIIERLKVQLEEFFTPFQSIFRVNGTQAKSDKGTTPTLPFRPVERQLSDEPGESAVWSKVDVATFANGRRRRESRSSDEEQVDVIEVTRPTKQVRTVETEDDARAHPRPAENRAATVIASISPVRSARSTAPRPFSSADSLPKIILDAVSGIERPSRPRTGGQNLDIERRGHTAVRTTGPMEESEQEDVEEGDDGERGDGEDEEQATDASSDTSSDRHTEAQAETDGPLEERIPSRSSETLADLATQGEHEMEVASDEEQNNTSEHDLGDAEHVSSPEPVDVDEVAHSWRDEIVGGAEIASDGGIQVHFDLDALLTATAQSRSLLSPSVPLSDATNDLSDAALQDAALTTDASTAEATLSRFIEKHHFTSMEVVGQFNLGFIIVRHRRAGQDDLMIIDQHAADEKFNFERLQATTRLTSQRLLMPRPLSLAPADELTAIEHRAALEAHGFQIEMAEAAVPGQRIRLVALPVASRLTFTVEDLEEVVHKLHEERPGSQRALQVRCSRWRTLLASRACRGSIMIGTALKRTTMQKVVHHLSTLEQPWNCPHGRPTMRHLYDLQGGKDKRGGQAAMPSSIDWTRL